MNRYLCSNELFSVEWGQGACLVGEEENVEAMAEGSVFCMRTKENSVLGTPGTLSKCRVCRILLVL